MPSAAPASGRTYTRRPRRLRRPDAPTRHIALRCAYPAHPARRPRRRSRGRTRFPHLPRCLVPLWRHTRAGTHTAASPRQSTPGRSLATMRRQRFIVGWEYMSARPCRKARRTSISPRNSRAVRRREHYAGGMRWSVGRRRTRAAADPGHSPRTSAGAQRALLPRAPECAGHSKA